MSRSHHEDFWIGGKVVMQLWAWDSLLTITRRTDCWPGSDACLLLLVGWNKSVGTINQEGGGVRRSSNQVIKSMKSHQCLEVALVQGSNLSSLLGNQPKRMMEILGNPLLQPAWPWKELIICCLCQGTIKQAHKLFKGIAGGRQGMGMTSIEKAMHWCHLWECVSTDRFYLLHWLFAHSQHPKRFKEFYWEWCPILSKILSA